MKKKLMAIFLCIAMLAAMAACAPANQEPPAEPEPGTPVEEEPEPELPNPMEEVSLLDFDNKLGWSINGWPEDYGFDHAFIVAGAVAEVDFKVDGDAVVFRTAVETEGDVSGVYDAFTDSTTGKLGDADVDIKYTDGETGLAVWYRDGYVHTLYMRSGASDDQLMAIAEKIDGSISIGEWAEK